METTVDLVENRIDDVRSPIGGDPVTRVAHFINPGVKAAAASNFKLPILTRKCSWPVAVEYNGWRDPQRNWAEWVDRMAAQHGPTWRNAGIYDAIQFSKLKFKRNDDLIKNFAERWCSDSNTFVFPWGEATITLEDIAILGGLPVLGSCTYAPLQGQDLKDLESKTKHVLETRRDHRAMLKHFGNQKPDSLFEHVAFLCLWLSRFVLPGNEFDRISDTVIPVAVSLSRGIRVALAPAVLANLYRDLGILSSTMKLAYGLQEAEESAMSVFVVGMWSPMQFVQLWIWERFVVFRPENPRFLKSGDVRAARWDGLGRTHVGNVRPILDSCGEVFLWRPYCLKLDEWRFPCVYGQDEECSLLLRKNGRFLEKEIEAQARCLRSCLLVGTDGNEPYQPHRVAMQFGLDQDIPGMIPRTIDTSDAWRDYTAPFESDFRLYIPARSFDGDVTVRYRKWWISMVQPLVGSFPGVVKGRRSSTPRCIKDHGSKQARLYSSSSSPAMVLPKPEPYYGIPFSEVPPGFPRKLPEDPPVPLHMFKNGPESYYGGCPGTFDSEMMAVQERARSPVEHGDGTVNLNNLPGSKQARLDCSSSSPAMGLPKPEPYYGIPFSEVPPGFPRKLPEDPPVPLHAFKNGPASYVGASSGTVDSDMIVVQERARSPVEDGDGPVNLINLPVPVKRSGGWYATEDVSEFVTNLEKLWAMARHRKIRGSDAAAKRVRR